MIFQAINCVFLWIKIVQHKISLLIFPPPYVINSTLRPHIVGLSINKTTGMLTCLFEKTVKWKASIRDKKMLVPSDPRYTGFTVYWIWSYDSKILNWRRCFWSKLFVLVQFMRKNNLWLVYKLTVTKDVNKFCRWKVRDSQTSIVECQYLYVYSKLVEHMFNIHNVFQDLFKLFGNDRNILVLR